MISIKLLGLLILIVFIAKFYFHLKLLTYKSGSSDFPASIKIEQFFVWIFLATVMLPYVRPGLTKKQKRTQRIVNWLILSFYITLVGLIFAIDRQLN